MMNDDLFHVFRCSPLGRETLMQSLYFCKMLNLELTVYIPESLHFMMYFENDAVQVDLDRSYISNSASAAEGARAIAAEVGLKPRFLTPKNHTASDLPDIPPQFAFMSCPRCISEVSSKIGLGYIGPKVRNIVRSATFPVLMTSPVFKPWKSIAVLFGGSESALNALRSGIQISQQSGYPLDLFIQLEQEKDYYDERIASAGLTDVLEDCCRHRLQFDEGDFAHNLYELPHDALVVSGAYGHNLIKEILFGSKVEVAQATLPNNILLNGPNVVTHLN